MMKDNAEYVVDTITRLTARVEELKELLNEAVDFADQKHHAVTRSDREMIERWRAAITKGESRD